MEGIRNNIMHGYYSQKLSAERLYRVYEIAPPRVQQYLEAEIAFVLDKTEPNGLALELGCGYGRVLEKLMAKAGAVVGIDTSYESLLLARERMGSSGRSLFYMMNAEALGFSNRLFDGVICIQNGISAFHVDPRKLIEEAVRVTRPGGTVLLSSYSERFWEDRLEWFQLQAEAGLIGEIDTEATGEGVIVCKDGFSATTVLPDDFVALTSDLDLDPRICEVDESSIFCEIEVPDRMCTKRKGRRSS